MSLFRLALSTAAYQRPLRESIRLAAAAGADGVQLDIRSEVPPLEFGETARRQLKHYLGEHNLRLGGCTLTTRGTLTDADHLDARVAAIQRGLEFTRQLGADALCVRLGAVPPDAAAREYERLGVVLSDLASVGTRFGVQLALSSLGNTPAALRGLLNSIDSGPLGVDVDPAGCVFAGLEPASVLRDLHDRVVHLQVRDGVRTAEGAGIETEIGAGEVAWDEVLATAAEISPIGWLTIRRTTGSDRAGDQERGLLYVRQILSGG